MIDNLNDYLNSKSKKMDPALLGSLNKMARATKDRQWEPMGGYDSIDYGINIHDRRYLEPSHSFMSPYDSKELQAYRQPWITKAGAMVGRIPAKILTEVLKMPGFIGGALAAPFAEEGERWETFVNNEWIKSMNKLNEDINEELLPVYVKKAIRDGDLIDNIFSIDFWATEGADAIGFIASMLLPGAALKGLRFGEAFSGAARAINIGIKPQTAQVAAATIANTMFEAANESGFAMDALEQDKTAVIKEYMDQGASIEEAEDMFEQQKARMARDIFAANVVILAGPNALMSKMIWGRPFNKGRRLLDDKGKLLTEIIRPDLATRIGRRVADVGKATASEGFWEEGMQMTVESMFKDFAKKGELTSNALNNFNLETLGDYYLDTVTSTEGQKAMFLGAFLGGGMYAYQGAKQDVRDRGAANQLLATGNNAIDAFYNIMTTNVYDENGKVDPKKVNKKLNSLNITEALNKKYEEALIEGDLEQIEALRHVAAMQLSYGFILNDQLGLDVLKAHLEASSQLEEIAQKEQNAGLKTTKQDIIDLVMNKAKVLERAYSNFSQYAPISATINKLNEPYNKKVKELEERGFTREEIENDPSIKQHKKLFQEFYDELGNAYLNNKASIDLFKKALEQEKSNLKEIQADLGFAEDVILDIEQLNEKQRKELGEEKVDESDERMKQTKENIKSLEKNIKEAEELDRKFWKSKELQKSFDEFVKENTEFRESLTPEQQVQYDKILDEISKFEDIKELEKYVLKLKEPFKNNPTIVKNAFQKLREIQTKEEAAKRKKEEEESEASKKKAQSDTDDGATTPDNDTDGIGKDNDGDGLGTAQDPSNDEVDNDGNTKDTSPKDFEDKPTDLSKSQGASKLMSTYRDSGKVIPGLENYVEYEKETRDKTGDGVTFQLGDRFEAGVKEAYDRVIAGTHTEEDVKLLEDKLPIKVTLTNKKKSASSYLLGKSQAIEQDPKALNAFKAEDLPLRKAIIKALIEHKSFDGIKGKVAKQFPGVLKLGNQNSNVLDLAVFEGMTLQQKLNYFKKNSFYVNHKGELVSTTTGNKSGQHMHSRNSGEVFLKIPKINGDPFFLKLNTNRINRNKAEVIYELILLKSRLNNGQLQIGEKGISPKISDLMAYLEQNQPDVYEKLNSVSEELKLIERNVDSVHSTLNRLLNVLIFNQNTNKRSKIMINEDGSVEFGTLLSKINSESKNPNIRYKYTAENFLESAESIREHLLKFFEYKRHNVLITKDNAFVFNNNDYLKYLLGIQGETVNTSKQVLSTNAAVNEPTFEGYSNIYLEHSVEVKGKPINSETVVKGQETLFDTLTDEKGELPSDKELKKADIERRIQEVENFVNQDFFASSELLSNHWKTKKDLFENKIKQLKSLLQKGIKTGEDLRTLTNLLNDIRGILNEGININNKTAILTNEKNIQELANSLFSLISDNVIKDYIQVMNKAMESRVGSNAVEKMLIGYSDGSGYTIDGKNVEYFLSKETLEKAKNNKQINTKYDAELAALEQTSKPNIQQVTHRANKYDVNLDSGTITNVKTGKTVNSTSAVGVAVLKQVDWDNGDVQPVKESKPKETAPETESETLINGMTPEEYYEMTGRNPSEAVKNVGESVLEMFEKANEEMKADLVFNLAEGLNMHDAIDVENLSESFNKLYQHAVDINKSNNEIKKLCGF